MWIWLLFFFIEWNFACSNLVKLNDRKMFLNDNLREGLIPNFLKTRFNNLQPWFFSVKNFFFIHKTLLWPLELMITTSVKYKRKLVIAFPLEE